MLSLDLTVTFAGHAKLRPLSAVRIFAALLVFSGATGCRRSPTPAVSVVPSATPTVAFVDAEQLLRLHPDISSLHRLDRAITRAGRRTTPPKLANLRLPQSLPLPLPDQPAEATAPTTKMDGARAREAVREDFEIRRRARPEQEEERYRRELERLRRRFLELRREPRTEAESDDLALALRNARRMSDLMAQLRSLQERPEDRLFYNAAQLRRRRELYRLTEQDLEDLRREEARRLERALEPTEAWVRRSGEAAAEIPSEEIARVERERDTLRREALAELDRLERMRLAEIDSTALPSPDSMRVQPKETTATSTAADEALAAMAARVKASEAAAGNAPVERSPARSAVGALEQERSQLRERLLQEVRALAASAGRARGMTVSFSRGSAPDRTSELANEVRRLFTASNGAGGKR